MGEFNKVTYLYGWCQKIIPLVYDESLSYYENLCKTREKLNEVITNTNMIPDMIKQEVQDFINSGQIEEMIEEMLTGYLQRIVVNVVVPPQGITPAKGNGNDDTETFQQCIDYLAENGGGLLFVPDGDWLTHGLTLKNGVFVGGASRSTGITLIGGSNTPLFSGTITTGGISNIYLSGHASFQTTDIILVDISADGFLMDNVRLSDAYTGLRLETTGESVLSGIYVDTIANTGLEISGTGNVSAEKIVVKEIGTVEGVAGIINNTTGSVFADFKVDTKIPNAVENTGDMCRFIGEIKQATTAIFNTGDSCLFDIALTGVTNGAGGGGTNCSFIFRGQLNTVNISNNASSLKTGEAILNAEKIQVADGERIFPAPSRVGNKVGIPYKDVDGNEYVLLTESYYMQNISYPYHNVYLDGVNGNDNNDGLTSATAFKTFDRAMQEANYYGDFRIYIVAAGAYSWSNPTLNGLTLHIVPRVNDVVLNVGANNPTIAISIYNCHINIGDDDYQLTLNMPDTAIANSQPIYFENCATTINNVAFNAKYKLDTFGGSLLAKKMVLTGRADFANTCGELQDCTFIATVSTSPMLLIREGSSFAITTAIEFQNPLESTGSSFEYLRLHGATCYCLVSPNTTGEPVYQAMDLSNSMFIMAPARFGAFIQKGAHPSTINTTVLNGQMIADEYDGGGSQNNYFDFTEVVYFGDSFMVEASNALVNYINNRLAIHNYHVYAQNGAGFHDDGVNPVFSDMVDGAVTELGDGNPNVTLAIVIGGLNDNTTPATATEIYNTLNKIHAGFPNAKIVMCPSPALVPLDRALLANIFNGVTQCGSAMLVNSQHWIYGRTDLFNSDNVHPNTNGLQTISRMLYSALTGVPAVGGFNTTVETPYGNIIFLCHGDQLQVTGALSNIPENTAFLTAETMPVWAVPRHATILNGVWVANRGCLLYIDGSNGWRIRNTDGKTGPYATVVINTTLNLNSDLA